MGGGSKRFPNDQAQRRHSKDVDNKHNPLTKFNRSHAKISTSNVDPNAGTMSTAVTTNASKSVLPSSPQPPRISISARERKRLIRSRRLLETNCHPSSRRSLIGGDDNNTTGTCSNGNDNKNNTEEFRRSKRQRIPISVNVDASNAASKSVDISSTDRKSTSIGCNGSIFSSSPLNNCKKKNGSSLSISRDGGCGDTYDGHKILYNSSTSLFANLNSNNKTSMTELHSQHSKLNITQPSEENAAANSNNNNNNNNNFSTPTNSNDGTNQIKSKSAPQPTRASRFTNVEGFKTPSFFGNVMKRSTQTEPPKAPSSNPTLLRSITSFFSSPSSQPPAVKNLSFDGTDQVRERAPRRPLGRMKSRPGGERLMSSVAPPNLSEKSEGDEGQCNLWLDSNALQCVPKVLEKKEGSSQCREHEREEKNEKVSGMLSTTTESQNVAAVDASHSLSLSSRSMKAAEVSSSSQTTLYDNKHCNQINQYREGIKGNDTELSKNKKSDTTVSVSEQNYSTLNRDHLLRRNQQVTQEEVGIQPPPSPSSSPFLLKIKNNASHILKRLTPSPSRQRQISSSPSSSSPSITRKRRKLLLSPHKLNWNPLNPDRLLQSTQISSTTTQTMVVAPTSPPGRNMISTVNSPPPSRKNSVSSSTLHTPKRKNSYAPGGSPSSIISAQSPGGFALLQILDNCKSDRLNHLHKSPQKSTSLKVKAKTYMEDDDIVSKDVHDDDTNSQNALEDWQKAWISLPSLGKDGDAVDKNNIDNDQDNDILSDQIGGVGIVDWSLKRYASFECYPYRCQPGLYAGRGTDTCNAGSEIPLHQGLNRNECSNSCTRDSDWTWDNLSTDNLIYDQPVIEKLAIHLLQDPNSSSRILDSFSEEMKIQAQWRAGLMYWQHPSVHPLPMSLLSTSTSNNRADSSRSIVEKTKNHGRHFFSPMSMPAPVSKLLKRQSSLPASYFSKQSQSFNSQLNQENKDSSQPISSISAPPSSSCINIENAKLLRRLEHYITQNRRRGGFSSSFQRAGFGSLGGLGRSLNDNRAVGDDSSLIDNVSSTRALLEKRETEWQESFRSMFFVWLTKIRKLQCKWRREIERCKKVEECLDNTGLKMQAIINEVNRVYFYSILPGQIVLFRASIISNEALDGCEHKNNVCKDEYDSQTIITPVIIISSSTLDMRSVLRSMGVKLMIREKSWKHQGNRSCKAPMDHQYNVEFKESFVDEWLHWGAKKKNDMDDLKVSEELEALRRATTHGETVGAEVNVSLTQRRKSSNQKQRSLRKFPPLSLYGNDDCLAFFEFYMNTCGNRMSKGEANLSDSRSIIDVPLLLCRSIGPTMHTSLRNLHTGSRFDSSNVLPPHAEEKENTDLFDAHQTSHVELRGPILPCSSRDLVCAAASHLLLNEKQKSENKKEINRNDLEKDEGSDAVGSHYFVMRSQMHEGEDEENSLAKNSSRERSIGTGNSFLFNGVGTRGNDFDGYMRECSDGEVIGMTVWDIARSNTIACKQSSLAARGDEI